MSKPTLYEVQNGAAWITLNQPERRNALSEELIGGLAQDLAVALGDDAVRVVVLTGAGSAFCAGADLKSGGVRTGDEAAEHPFVHILKTIWNAPKPIIGRINGHAFGGGLGLTAACDLTVAAASAKFSFSEVRVGVVPAMISVVVIPKIGIHNTMWLFLTGERFSAEQAREYGLLHRVVPDDGLDAAVDEIVGMVRLGGPNAIREAKQLIRRVPQLSMDDAFRHTSDLIGRLFASEEALEGMQAFAEKRKPTWAS
jgi:enoyl-CoA hydratase/carnithine racemase